MPSAVPAVSRRQVLVGAAALAVISATAAACGSAPGPPKVDDLQEQLDLARHDSDMAKAAAAAEEFHAPALTVVSAERAAHARALAQEIARAAGTTTPPTETTSPTTTTATSSGAANPSTPPPSLSEVTAALRNSADSAAQLAAKLSGYRAGLLGSIAASCTASVTVPLAMKQPAQ